MQNDSNVLPQKPLQHAGKRPRPIPIMSKKQKGTTKVTIFKDWCKGCGLCAAFCPAKVMEMSPLGKAEVVREEECINCGFCELHCPDFAIMVTPKDATAQVPGAAAQTIVELDHKNNC